MTCAAIGRLFAIFLILIAMRAAPALAQEEQGRSELTVATREAPPFVMRDAAGEWTGLAIALWRNIAEEQGLRYRFVEAGLTDMVDGVKDGRYDASAGALTITPAREEAVDFTHPYYTTGFGIAARKAPPAWISLLGNFFSWSFLQAVLLLAALLLAVGVLFWLAERRHNPDQFGGGARKGIGSGFWFSAVTMTTVGYGDKAPSTLAGKIVAIVWMFAAIIIISTFTGMIASSLTANRLAETVSGPDDLPRVAVGSIKGSSSELWLAEDGLGFESFDSVAEGLEALRDGEIDAFVYDKPILQHLVRIHFENGLRLVPGTYGRQDYGIALPEGSGLREPMNLALLNYIESADWQRRLRVTLGKQD